MSEIYGRRRDLMIDALAAIGLPGQAAAGDPVYLGAGPGGLLLRDLHGAGARRRRPSSFPRAFVRPERGGLRAHLAHRRRRAPRGGRASASRLRFASRPGHNSGVTHHQPDPAPGAEPERGFLVAVLAQGVDEDEELAEMRELLRTAGVEPVGELVQRRLPRIRAPTWGRESSPSSKRPFRAAAPSL